MAFAGGGPSYVSIYLRPLRTVFEAQKHKIWLPNILKYKGDVTIDPIVNGGPTILGNDVAGSNVMGIKRHCPQPAN